MNSEHKPNLINSKPKLIPTDGLNLLANPKKNSDNTNKSNFEQEDNDPDFDLNYENDDEEIKHDNDNDIPQMNNNEENNNIFDDTPNLFNSEKRKNQDEESVISGLSDIEEPPQKTYEEIQQEKQKLLFKLDRLGKAGYSISRRYTMASPLEDIQYEYNRLKRQRDVDKSVKFSRKMLMACVSGVEYLNGKFDPLDIKLDGWSENCMENISDYDEVFEELHDKYAEKVKMAPELKLLMMVGGSAFMFHLTNTFFKSSMPSMNDILKQNPDIMKNVTQAALHSMNNQYNNDPVLNMMKQGVQMHNNNNNNSSSHNSMNSNHNMNSHSMSGPRGVDDILNNLHSSNNIQLSSDIDSDTEPKNITLGNRNRKRRSRKSSKEINISL